MAKTPKERGKTAIAIEFDTKVLKRLRNDARLDQRSVGYLVRQIVARHYAEIDDLRGKHLSAPSSQPDRSVVFSREDTSIGALSSRQKGPFAKEPAGRMVGDAAATFLPPHAKAKEGEK